MNERIEALAKQAAEYAIEFAVKDQELYIPKLMEKFAELIVRECVLLFDGSTEMKTVGMLSHKHVVEQIKQHFGVEE